MSNDNNPNKTTPENQKINSFKEFDLPENLQHSLQHLGFIEPTPIQSATIDSALKGNDILGSAQTGTGKTGAFGIPLLAKLINNKQSAALVIAPTRELATQVMKSITDMIGKKSDIKNALLIGGESIGKQLSALRRKPRLFVGTPGRINDHLERGTLKLKNVDYLVLDETDRMLDMGFSIQIDNIVKHLPKERQTLLFSATLPKNIVKIASSYMQDPQRIAVGSTTNPAKNIKQTNIHISESEKYDELLKQLSKRDGSIIVFVKTKFGTEKMAKKLNTEGYKANAIHGDLQHRKRERVINSFRNKKYKILVATDIAARGLDIPHIEHVINHDLPQCPEDYIHRIGRTARAGADGEAVCFISPAEKGKWGAIMRLIDPESKEAKFKDNKKQGGKGRKFGGKKFGRSNNKGSNFKPSSNNKNKRKKFKSNKAA